MSSGRWRFVGILWSIIWIAAVGLYGLHRADEDPRRYSMLCIRMQAEAKSDPRCADPASVLHEQLCRFRDASCQSRIPPATLAAVAAAALLPPLLAWTLALVRLRRRSRT